MKKIFAILIIGILALTIGCATEGTNNNQTQAQTQTQTEPQVTITWNQEKSQYAYQYTSEQGYVYKAPEGKAFFLLYLNIENKNCPKYSVKHYGFKVMVNQVVYDPYIYYGPYDLKDVDLLPGGKTEGFILFQIADEDIKTAEWRYDNPYAGCTATFIIK